jgi:hypothetical protein
MAAVLRDALVLLTAFVLGVIATLAYFYATGYEYRCAASSEELRQLINTAQWESVPNITPQQVGCLYLRRPRVRLP